MENQQLWLLQRIYHNDVTPIVIKEGLYKIGRSPESNILCKSEWVSRFHCDVTVRDGLVYIKDLGSLNGTYIEETEIFKKRDIQLKHGDVISLGKPFLGGNPESDHYVYKLVACTAPQEPQNRKRKASSSPPHEIAENRPSLSPKRRRTSVEKCTAENKNEVPGDEKAVQQDAIKVSHNERSVGSNRTKSSSIKPPLGRVPIKEEPAECIDLTNDEVIDLPIETSKTADKPIVDKAGHDSNVVAATVINRDAEEVLKVVWKYIQNNESNKLLKTLLSREESNGEENEQIRKSLDSQHSSSTNTSLERAVEEEIIQDVGRSAPNFSEGVPVKAISFNESSILTKSNLMSNIKQPSDNHEESVNVHVIQSKHVEGNPDKSEVMIMASSSFKEKDLKRDSLLMKSDISEINKQEQQPVLFDEQTESVSPNYLKSCNSSDKKSLLNSEVSVPSELEDIDNFLKTFSDEESNPSGNNDLKTVQDFVQDNKKNEVISSSKQGKKLGGENAGNCNIDVVSVENNTSASAVETNQFKDMTVINIKQELLSEDLVLDEEMVFSQDLDGVVEIDSSGDELEYSQIFMEVADVQQDEQEDKNNKREDVLKEEFFYDISDDNEDGDLFQSHFSQCSQEQEAMITSDIPKKRRQSQSSSSDNELAEIELQKSETVTNGEKSYPKMKDIQIKLKRLEVESLLSVDGSSCSTKLIESKVEYLEPKDHKSNKLLTGCYNPTQSNCTQIIDLENLEIIKSDKGASPDVESLTILKRTESKSKCVSGKSETSQVHHSLCLAKPIGTKEAETVESNIKTNELLQINKSGKTKETVELKGTSIENKKLSASNKSKNNAVKNLSSTSKQNISGKKNKIEGKNKECKAAISLKKVDSEKDLNIKLLEKNQNHIAQSVKLPPPDSMSGSKLVKSTLLSKPPVERKKPGRPRKKESSVTKEAIKKQTKKQIIEERRFKLKSLALKEKEIPQTENSVPNNDQGLEQKSACSTTSHSAEKINDKRMSDTKIENSKESNDKNESAKLSKVAKITERNRSSILLEGFLEAPGSRRARMQRKVRKANAQNEKPTSTSVIEPPTSSNKSVVVTSSRAETESSLVSVVGVSKSCLKTSNKSSSLKKVTFKADVDIREFECQGMLKSVSAMVSKDKVISSPLPTPLSAVATASITTLDETYFDIVHWNASWITEIKVVPGEPPVYVEKYNGKDSYVSYRDYKRWIYPLMMYELWGNMCKTMIDEDSNKTGRTFDGIVLESLQFGVRSSNGKNLLVLKCFFPLYGKQVQNTVDPMDILLIKALSTTEGKRICFVLFGLVYSSVKITSYRETCDPVGRAYLNTLCAAPEACAYFDIIIYRSQQKAVSTGFQLRIRPTYNMMNELRQFESLIKLAGSPLSHIIIDPLKNYSTYLQNDLSDKIVTQYPLNDEQRKAILCTSQSVFANIPAISLIHGPPGTGKSQVIVGIIEQLLYRFKLKNNNKRKKILICSQSNAAIDEICIRLLDIRKQLPREKRFKLTRFGRKEKIHPRVLEIQTTTLARKEVEKRNLNEDFTLELSLHKATERMVATALENTNSPNIENYKRKYERVQKIIAGLEAIVNNTSSNEAKDKEIEKLVFDEEMKVIYHSDIIATTLGSCPHRKIMKALNELSRSDDRREIGVCIIDEATQATEADVLLPLVYDVKNFILVGDPHQLPPFVMSQTAKKCGLGNSLFSRLYKVWANEPKAPVFFLRTQYRMHPSIAQFPSKAFYNNQLNTPSFLAIKRPFEPYAVITHTFSQDSCDTNIREASLVVEIAERLLSEPAFKGLSIGMIVPYQRQRLLILDLLKDKKLMKQLTVNTIDSYQGQERDVILLSCVRTSGVGFLNDNQRMNVALTRAKKAMYIIANFASLMNTSIWSDLLSDARERCLHIDIGHSGNTDSLFDFLFERNKKSRTSSS